MENISAEKSLKILLKYNDVSVIKIHFSQYIEGSFDRQNGRGVVNIKMRLNHFVKGFCIFWFSVVILACIIPPFFKCDMPFYFVPYIMLLFGILIVSIAYKVEVKKAKEKLETLIK